MSLRSCGLWCPQSMQRQDVRIEDAERRDGDARERQQARDRGEPHHASDDGGRCQHDRNLERGGSNLEVMVFFGGEVTLLFRMLGALGEFLTAFMGRRLGAVARRSLL